jgi:anti-sigma factor RsiW
MRLGRRGRSAHPRLTCPDVVELITDYIEGALRPDAAARVATHLAECDGCAAYLDQMRSAAAMLPGLELPGLPEDACEKLVDAFRDWQH